MMVFDEQFSFSRRTIFDDLVEKFSFPRRAIFDDLVEQYSFQLIQQIFSDPCPTIRVFFTTAASMDNGGGSSQHGGATSQPWNSRFPTVDNINMQLPTHGGAIYQLRDDAAYQLREARTRNEKMRNDVRRKEEETEKLCFKVASQSDINDGLQEDFDMLYLAGELEAATVEELRGNLKTKREEWAEVEGKKARMEEKLQAVWQQHDELGDYIEKAAFAVQQREEERAAVEGKKESVQRRRGAKYGQGTFGAARTSAVVPFINKCGAPQEKAVKVRFCRSNMLLNKLTEH